MACLGMSKPTDFANHLELGANGYRKVKRWLDADNDPDFESTIKMLEACGWLNMNANGQVAGASSAIPPEALLAELALGQAALLEHFGIQIEAAQTEAEAKPKRRSRRK